MRAYVADFAHSSFLDHIRTLLADWRIRVARRAALLRSEERIKKVCMQRGGGMLALCASRVTWGPVGGRLMTWGAVRWLCARRSR